MAGDAGRAGDPHDLDRFRRAQDPLWDTVRAELEHGLKETHWSWFVLPQIAGLSRSDMGRRYAIGSLDEARAYLAHPVLGPRLAETARLMLAHAPAPPERALGGTDARKLRSSMTLFEAAADGPPAPPFTEVLDRLFAGARCPDTAAWLAKARG
jgi:uncharacterized protein (DUF1810 family)